MMKSETLLFTGKFTYEKDAYYAAKIGDLYLCVSYFFDLRGTYPPGSQERWIRGIITSISRDQVTFEINDDSIPGCDFGFYRFADDNVEQLIRPHQNMVIEAQKLFAEHGVEWSLE